MSDREPRPGRDDLFPSNWVIGTAAAELARGDDGVLVDPHVNQVLVAGPDGRPAGIQPPRSAVAAPTSVPRGGRREPTLRDEAILRPGSDATRPGPGDAVADAEIAALWSETSRLQRRFASSPGKTDAPAVGLSSEPGLAIPAMPIDNARSAMPRSHHAWPGGWFMAVVGSVLVAAAIVMAGKLGLLDAPRSWLHGQFDRLSAPAAASTETVAPAQPVYSIRRDPVSPAD